jgi:hypothetical protein
MFIIKTILNLIKSMKKIICSLVLLVSILSYSQKPPSQEAINDVVNRASAYFRIEQNDKFRYAVNRYFTTYNKAGAAAVMSNLKKELKGREDILIFFNRATANHETLLGTLTALNVKPKNAKEIADYFFSKPVQQEVQAIDTAAVEKPAEELSVEEVLKPIEWLPPSAKFFDGSKTFCDSSGKSYYTVTIMKSNILLIKYSGQPSKESKSIAAVKTKAVINGDHIVSSRNHPTNYKFENNILYEKAEEPNGWNKFVECPIK